MKLLIEIDQVQKQIEEWVTLCFGADQLNEPKVRAMRLVEEAIEFAQAVGVPVDKCHQLSEYVYGRPPGEAAQELGGVALTAIAAASSLKLQFGAALLDEVQRVTSKPPEHFAARNQVKREAGFK